MAGDGHVHQVVLTGGGHAGAVLTGEVIGKFTGGGEKTCGSLVIQMILTMLTSNSIGLVLMVTGKGHGAAGLTGDDHVTPLLLTCGVQAEAEPPLSD